MPLWLWVLIAGYGLFVFVLGWALMASSSRDQQRAGYKGSADELSEVEIAEWRAQHPRTGIRSRGSGWRGAKLRIKGQDVGIDGEDSDFRDSDAEIS